MSHFKHSGVTLIELLLAIAISSVILMSLNSLVSLGLEAQTVGRENNELLYQAHFALDRIVDKARKTSPKVLTTPTVNTTGDWFSPSGCLGASCLMYCRNSNNQLIETVNNDLSCSGNTVIANNVISLLATLPANMGGADRHIAVITLNFNDGKNNTTSFSAYVRLGGGVL